MLKIKPRNIAATGRIIMRSTNIHTFSDTAKDKLKTIYEQAVYLTKAHFECIFTIENA